MSDDEGKARARSGPISLEDEEIRLLLRACQRYQMTLPAYLQSSRSELELLAKITGKLGEQLEDG